MEDDYLKMLKFEESLRQGIRKLLSAMKSKDYQEAYRRSIRIESETARNGEGHQAEKQKVFESKINRYQIHSSASQRDTLTT